MSRIRAIEKAAVVLALLAGSTLAAVAREDGLPAIVYVRLPADPAKGDDAGNGCREGSALVLRTPGGSRRVLSEGLAGACDPTVADDGETIYFSGLRNGLWRIFRVRPGGKPVQVTAGARDVFEPLVLPGGDLVFRAAGAPPIHSGESHSTSGMARTKRPAAGGPKPGADVVEVGGDLWRLPAKGKAYPITFSGARLRRPRMLPDGRIAVCDADSGAVYALYPDGTWMMPLYIVKDAKVRDLAASGADRVLLIVDERGGRERRLLAASFYDPLKEAVPVGPGSTSFRGVAPLSDGKWIVAMGAPGAPARLAVLAGGAATPLGGDAAGADPVVLVKRGRLPILPSTVKPKMTTGELLILDVRRTDDEGIRPVLARAVALVVKAPSGETRAPVARDGSVYARVPADEPLSLVLENEKGKPVASMTAPFWVRPNEQRACVGCHASPRYAPPNVRPVALAPPEP